MTKLCLVYNCCGISGRENSDYYIQAIDSILDQTFDGFELIISGCCLSTEVKQALMDKFSAWVTFCWTDSIYPVPVTFNLACLKAIKAFGEFEGYMYIDSGIKFLNKDDLQKFYDGWKQHEDCGMYAARVDFDGGLHQWFGIGRDIYDISEDYKLFVNGDFVIPVGKTCNLHVQIFSYKIVEYYGRPYVDIWAGHMSESVFSFVCAALKLKFVINKDILAHHEHLDGASSGFNPFIWEASGRKRSEHPYLIPSIMDVVASEEAKKLGLGYEECTNLVPHDKSQYDENGFCINDGLKRYIRDNLYLPKHLLDYEVVECDFV